MDPDARDCHLSGFIFHEVKACIYFGMCVHNLDGTGKPPDEDTADAGMLE